MLKLHKMSIQTISRAAKDSGENIYLFRSLKKVVGKNNPILFSMYKYTELYTNNNYAK